MGGAAVIRRLPCRSPVYRSSFGGVFGNGRARFGQIVAGVGVGNLESAQAFGVRGGVTDAGQREDVDFLVGEVSKSSDDVGFLDYGWRRCRSRWRKGAQFGRRTSPISGSGSPYTALASTTTPDPSCARKCNHGRWKLTAIPGSIASSGAAHNLPAACLLSHQIHSIGTPERAKVVRVSY